MALTRNHALVFLAVCAGAALPVYGFLVSRAPRRAALPTTADAIVVGGGIAGLSAAYELAAGGADVIVVDMASIFGGHAVMATGDLTIVGVTRPVSLNVTSFRCIQHPVNKREMCGADASVAIKRSEWGIKRGATGIGDDVKISVQIEAHKE